MTDGTCFNGDLSETGRCTTGDGEKLAIITGDSIAMSWTPGVIKALKSEGYRVHAVGMSDCPFADVRVTLENKDFQKRCNSSRDALYQHIRSLQPDLLVTSDCECDFGRLASGDQGATAVQEWTRGMVDAIEAVSAGRTKVVVLAPPPGGKSPDACAGRTSTPKDCASSIDKSWLNKAAAEAAAVEAAGPRVRYVDSQDWFCFNSRCPIFALGTTVRWDAAHLTVPYAELLAPKLRAALLDIPEEEPVAES